MREAGIDADAALESGALSVHTEADTYLRTGEFDRDAMVAFWEDALAEARDEDGDTGVRAAAEMTWAPDGGTSHDRLVEYEAVLNSVFSDDDYVVLCQYNRERSVAGGDDRPHDTGRRGVRAFPPRKCFLRSANVVGTIIIELRIIK